MWPWLRQSSFTVTTKAQSVWEKIHKFDFIKIKNCSSEDTVDWKNKAKDRRKHLQIIYLTKNLYPEYRKNPPILTISKQSNLKIGKRFEYTFPKRYIDDK